MYMFVYFVRFRSNLAWAIPVNEDTPPWKTNIGTFPQENKPTGLLPFESNEVIGIKASESFRSINASMISV